MADDAPPRGVRVVCAGMGRTGTTSLAAALEILGFGPVYHMNEVLAQGASHVDTWHRAYSQPVDWKSFLQPYGAVCDGPAHLFYEGPVHHHDFKNFHLKAEVMTFPHANSGIYFHTKYQEEGWPAQGFEAQVNQTHADPKKTGGLYAVKDVMNVSPAEDGKWFLYEIIVEGKHVVLKIDGKVTTDWTEPTPPAPPKGMEGRVIGHGTIALQGHDPGSEVHYRNIRIKQLGD